MQHLRLTEKCEFSIAEKYAAHKSRWVDHGIGRLAAKGAATRCYKVRTRRAPLRRLGGRLLWA
jgi:hypothetical protein